VGDQLRSVWRHRAKSAGDSVWQVHIETDLVREVHADPDPFPALAELNRLASLSACVLENRSVRRHASVSVTLNNLPFSKELAVHAMSLQVTDARAVARWLSGQLRAVEDLSHHPVSGPRPAPDDMLGVALLYRRKREDGVWTPPIDFIGVANASNRCWLSATAGTHHSPRSCRLADAGRRARRRRPATALFQTWTDKPHPVLAPARCSC
jgi:hypothetical protein